MSRFAVPSDQSNLARPAAMAGRVHPPRVRRILPALLLLSATFAGGCTGDLAPPADVVLTPLERQGYQVFQRERCFYTCHVVGTALTERTATGEVLTVYPPDLRTTPRRSVDWYRAYLIDPQAVLWRSSMPAFDYLSTEDLHALVAFVRRLNTGVDATEFTSVAAEEVPPPARDLSAYQAGRAIYRRNCLGCHGEWGNGGGPVGHLLLPEPRDFTDAAWMSKRTEIYLFSVITNGKPRTAMPAFDSMLTVTERGLVLRYLEYFADPVNRERMELGFVLAQTSNP